MNSASNLTAFNKFGLYTEAEKQASFVKRSKERIKDFMTHFRRYYSKVSGNHMTAIGRRQTGTSDKKNNDGAFAALWKNPAFTMMVFSDVFNWDFAKKALNFISPSPPSFARHAPAVTTTPATALTPLQTTFYEAEFGSVAFASHVEQTVANAVIEANDNAHLVLDADPIQAIYYAENVKKLKNEFESGSLTADELLPRIAQASLENQDIQYSKEHDAYVLGAGKLSSMRGVFEQKGKNTLGSIQIMTFREAAETQKIERPQQPALQVAPPRLAYATASPAPAPTI